MTTETIVKNGRSRHKVKEFGFISTGTTPSTKNEDYYGGPYKLISPADLSDSKYIVTAHKLVTEKGLKVARTVPRNAILVGCIGNVGKIGVTIDEASAFNQQINAIVCNDKFDTDFVYYLLRYQKPLLKSRAAKVTVPILNKNNFENIEFEVPNLPEQKAIARVLTTVQEAIAGQEELIAKLKELKRSMMQRLFTHGTKGEKTKITEIGEIPESWEINILGEVGTVSYGIQAAVAALLKPVGYKILTNKNITLQGDIILDKVNYYQPITRRELSSFVGNGDVLLNWRSGSKEHVGKTAIYTGDEKILHSSFILRIRTDNRKVINRFLFYYINWLRETGYFVKKQTYSVNAKFNKSSVLSMNIAVPPTNQQVKILEVLESISSQTELAVMKYSAYQNLFKTLLHELMSGERRVNN